MAFTQGLFAKLVADTAPAELLGTAFGIFNLVSGGALLLASVIAGGLWSCSVRRHVPGRRGLHLAGDDRAARLRPGAARRWLRYAALGAGSGDLIQILRFGPRLSFLRLHPPAGRVRPDNRKWLCSGYIRK